jgi:hypothetical protein
LRPVPVNEGQNPACYRLPEKIGKGGSHTWDQ